MKYGLKELPGNKYQIHQYLESGRSIPLQKLIFDDLALAQAVVAKFYAIYAQKEMEDREFLDIESRLIAIVIPEIQKAVAKQAHQLRTSMPGDYLRLDIPISVEIPL